MPPADVAPVPAAAPAAGEAMAVIGRGVTLAYGPHVALSGADFTVPVGAVTALIGPNGSGKSSLLHAIAGLLPPRDGTLTVLGMPADEARARVAYVLQSTKVNEQMPATVREVVSMGRFAVRGVLGRLRPDDRAAVEAAMARLEVADLAQRQLGELSGGQRQRVFVAQGLAQQAELLLLDEPVTGLDLVSRQRILDVIDEERAAGRTVVVTTHDLGEAAAADHVVLVAGRVIADGPAAAVLTADHLSAAYGARLLHLGDGTAVLLDDPHHHAEGHDHTICADDDEPRHRH